MAPYGTDELALAGALSGEPVEVVKAETVDLEVPATAEIIIEGTVLPNVREDEGPFGEVSGYYTPSNPKPIIEVSAITHRKNPIYQAALTGMPTTENHVSQATAIGGDLLLAAEKRVPRRDRGAFPGRGHGGDDLRDRDEAGLRVRGAQCDRGHDRHAAQQDHDRRGRRRRYLPTWKKSGGRSPRERKRMKT